MSYRPLQCDLGAECERDLCFFAHNAQEIRRASIDSANTCINMCIARENPPPAALLTATGTSAPPSHLPIAQLQEQQLLLLMIQMSLGPPR
jgi:hypothetical protein